MIQHNYLYDINTVIGIKVYGRICIGSVHTLLTFKKLNYIYFICMWVGVMRRGIYMDVRGKFLGVSSLLSPCGSYGLNSGYQAWQ